MPSNIIINRMTTQHKASVGITSCFPDVCKTPAPPAPSPVPIPYPNVANSPMASVKVSKRVADNTQKVMLKGAAYALSNGDQAGVAMGVVSNKIMGKSVIKNQSFTVKFEKKGVGRLKDPHGNNSGSNPNGIAPMQGQPPAVGMSDEAKEAQEAACKALAGAQVPDAEVEMTAEKYGMAGEHAKSMQDYCGKEGVSATFRSGNKDQIQHLRGTKGINGGNPCPAKPKEVKNKSINLEKRGKTLGKPVDADLKKKIADNKLDGLVGDYDENGKLTGIVNTKGVQRIEDIPPVKGIPYTGDYDAHEFFGKDGKRITGDMTKEDKMIDGLNAHMGRDGSYHRPDVVMHGPQANYTEYCEMMGEEPDPGLQKPSLGKDGDEPLLVFDSSGRMYTLKSEEDLDNYYKCKGAEKPPEWG